MKVSVIITNYNYSKYIRQCIQSVLDSDFDAQNMEIIIVDDASTDNSVEIIRQIKLNSNSNVTINLIKNGVNLGLIRSRNLGIFHATGAFLFMLDADNYIGKDCIRKHYECLSSQHDVIACYAPIERFADSTGEMLFVFSNEAFDYQRLFYGNYIDAMAIFRKSTLVRIGMYDTNMPPYGWEDYELWLRIGKLNEKVALIHGPALSYYRVHENSLQSKCSFEKKQLIVQYLKLYHPLKYDLSQGNDGELIFSPIKDQFAQLFFANSVNQNTRTDSPPEIIIFDELNSLKVAVESTTKTIDFKFPYAQTITNLRFDPLNDYCQLSIKSIQMFHQGKPLETPFILSSNALHVANEVYLFDTTDAQIHINFLNKTSIFIDQVIVNIDGYRMDSSLIPLIFNH
jgi:glycosyltransferase involved in cell wall biosynthesis